MTSKKERDHLCFIVDERSNELRNVKQKNEQLEQMIRNGKEILFLLLLLRLHFDVFDLDEEHRHDEKKLFALLHESQEERDELLTQKVQFFLDSFDVSTCRAFPFSQRQTNERFQKLEEQLKYSENDAAKLRDNALCSKIKLEKKIEENERLNGEMNEMKKFTDRLEQENQKLKQQIDLERAKVRISLLLLRCIFRFVFRPKNASK